MSLFLSYDWEADTLDRITEINEDLLMSEFQTSFEEHRVEGDVTEAMKDAMDHSDMVVCFFTRRYVDQLQSPETNSRLSWCRREWAHAHKEFDSSSIIIVLLEPEMLEGDDAAFVRAVTDDSPVIDFTDGFDVQQIVEVYEEYKEKAATGAARRPRTKLSFIEAPVDWDETERILYYPNGEKKYVGTLLFGKMHGQGTYYYQNGDWYEGSFEEDYFSGMGTYHSRSGAFFEGNFSYDRRHGFGRSYRADGSLKFAGEYARGIRDGRGTEYDTDGNPVREAIFEDGQLVEELGGVFEDDASSMPTDRSPALSTSTAGSGGSNSSGGSKSSKGSRKSLGRRISTFRAGKFKIPKKPKDSK